MKKRLSCIVAAAFLGLLAGPALAQSAPIKLRFGHAHPTNDSQHIAAVEFAKNVKERTKGAIEIQVFPNNQLGNDNTMIAGVRGGTIDIETSGNPFFTGIVPKLNALDLPYLFESQSHIAKVLDGATGRSLLNELEAYQMKGLAFWEVGFRSLANSRRPVNKAEDIKGLKLRTTPNQAHIKAFQLLGAAPQPMPFAEVYSALETKAIDGHENPPSVMLSTKMHEVQKYLSLTKHAYTALIVVMNKAKFDALPPAHQKALVEAAREAGQYQRQLNNENIAKITADVKKAGMQVVEKVDGTPFLAATKPGRDTFTAKFGGADIIKAIDAVRDTK